MQTSDFEINIGLVSLQVGAGGARITEVVLNKFTDLNLSRIFYFLSLRPLGARGFK